MRGTEQRIRIIGGNLLYRSGRVNAVVEHQLAWIRRGAVDAPGGVDTGTTVKAGARQVLRGIEAKRTRHSEHFCDQQRQIQWNDIGIDAAQLADQLSIQVAGETADQAITATQRRGVTHIGQQRNHDVARTRRLQGFDAVNQTACRSLGLRGIEDSSLKEIVAAAVYVIQGIAIKT